MATVLPNGYSRWVPTFTLDGSTKIFQTVFMVNNDVEVIPSEIDVFMRTVMCGTSTPFNAANMFIGYTLAKSEAWLSSGGDVFYFLNETAINGTKAGSTG